MTGINPAMSSAEISAATFARDPLWLAHRYQPDNDAFHLRRVTREQHRAATFLTDEYLTNDRADIVIARHAALAEAGEAAPLHFIFHSAFCGSTLLARAFDIEGVAMGLKEPVVLNDVSGLRRHGVEARRVAEALDAALTMLARPFGAGEAVVVKPSNVVSGYIPAIMAMRPSAKAVLLYAPLPVFLGSVARKGLWGRLWVRELLAKLIEQELVDLGFQPDDYFRLTDLQVAALGWLAQQALFTRLVERFGPERIRTLDSERLMAQPLAAMRELGEHFALAFDPARVIAGPAFTTHSKFGQSFDAATRAAERAAQEQSHADELAKVGAWAEAVAANAGVDLALPLSIG